MNLRLLDGKRRFVFPILVLIVVRFLCGLLLYTSLKPSNWLNLFSRWDSGHYLVIAGGWYPPSVSPVWAFFPLYPAAIRLVGWIIPDITLAAFVVSTISGLAAMVLYQLVAEHYTAKGSAMQSTLVYFLLPPVFVFSMVNYSESLFLLLALLTWKLHLQERDFAASLAAGLTALTKTDGLIIILPLAYDYLKSREFSKLALLAVPALAVVGWVIYGEIMTGTLIPFSGWHFWRTENMLLIRKTLNELLMGNTVNLYRFTPYANVAVASLAFLILFALVAREVWKVDRALFLYVCVSAIGVLGVGSIVAFRSVPRLLAFLFPLGLPLYFRERKVTYAIILTLVALDYIAWFAFLTDGFY